MDKCNGVISGTLAIADGGNESDRNHWVMCGQKPVYRRTFIPERWAPYTEHLCQRCYDLRDPDEQSKYVKIL